MPTLTLAVRAKVEAQRRDAVLRHALRQAAEEAALFSGDAAAVDELVTPARGAYTSAKSQSIKATARRLAVLAIERTYAADGRPVETASIVASGDRYELHYGIPVAD